MDAALAGSSSSTAARSKSAAASHCRSRTASGRLLPRLSNSRGLPRAGDADRRARVEALLPQDATIAEDDPGAVALIWADWQSCGDDCSEILDPVRGQYKECFAVIRCQWEGETWSRSPYIWVDKDFALARGYHQGYPKKLGDIWMTRPITVGRAGPRLEPGGRFCFFLNHPLLQTPGSGWIDDQLLDPPEQYWRIGPYLTEQATVEEVEIGVRIRFVHRPLSRYLNALAANGLVLEWMLEPAPPPGFLALAPEYVEAATVPRLLYLRTRRV